MYDDAAAPSDDDPTVPRRGTHIISRPEQLLAELPALLQFVPESSSLVVLGQADGRGHDATPIMRMDIPASLVLTEHLSAGLGPVEEVLEDLAKGDHELVTELSELREHVWSVLMHLVRMDVEFASHIAGIADSQELSKAVAVLLLGDGCTPDSPEWDGADRFAAKLDGWFAGVGVDLSGVLVAESIAAGAAWRFAGEGTVHRQLDPQSSDLAVRQVVQGRRILGRRSEIGQLYEPDEGPRVSPDVLVGVESLRDPAGDVALGTLVSLARSGDEGSRRDREVLQQSATILCSPNVFEFALRRLVQHEYAEVPHDAEPSSAPAPFGVEPVDLELLLDLVRQGDQRVRGAALTFLGVAHYLRGNGVHTLECLERAAPCGFMPYFGRLVLSMIRRGECPQDVREILRELLDGTERLSA